MKLQITNFEDGIQRIVRKIVARQGREIPIICVQGDPNAGKTELNNRLHTRLLKDHNLIGFSGKIEQVVRYQQEIRTERTAYKNPKYYLIEDLPFPVTFIAIYRRFNRMPDLGVQLTRQLPSKEQIQIRLDFFHDLLNGFYAKPKKSALDLIVYNPEARDK